MTITSRSCLVRCADDLDCRWNAYDTFRSACGQYECTAPPGAPGERVCLDERQH